MNQADRAERVTYLPADWPINLADEAFSWPVQWLKTIARLPHIYGTSLLPGDTIPNGDPPEPAAVGTGFSGFVVWPGTVEEADFRALIAADGQRISFWSLYPLYTSEMEFKLRKGFDALASKLGTMPLSLIVDVARPAVA